MKMGNTVLLFLVHMALITIYFDTANSYPIYDEKILFCGRTVNKAQGIKDRCSIIYEYCDMVIGNCASCKDLCEVKSYLEQCMHSCHVYMDMFMHTTSVAPTTNTTYLTNEDRGSAMTNMDSSEDHLPEESRGQPSEETENDIAIWIIASIPFCVMLGSILFVVCIIVQRPWFKGEKSFTDAQVSSSCILFLHMFRTGPGRFSSRFHFIFYLK